MYWSVELGRLGYRLSIRMGGLDPLPVLLFPSYYNWGYLGSSLLLDSPIPPDKHITFWNTTTLYHAYSHLVNEEWEGDTSPSSLVALGPLDMSPRAASRRTPELEERCSTDLGCTLPLRYGLRSCGRHSIVMDLIWWYGTISCSVAFGHQQTQAGNAPTLTKHGM